MHKYLEASPYIDWETAAIKQLATELAHEASSGNGLKADADIAKQCFEWVRDNIQHSFDYQLNPVTCKASDVLQHKTGYCYAKSHLLAALLRANNIPAGLCYQRLSINDNGAPYSLHGLNAVFLKDHGWYRIDARGNKEGINAEFKPPQEQLAFALVNSLGNDALEQDFAQICSEPLPCVVDVLEASQTYMDVYNNLPDLSVISSPT